MKKLLIVGVLAASFIVPAAASAKVERCAATTVTNSGPKTATFTVLQPKDTVGQFSNVWVHNYEVAVNSDGSFVGTGSITDNSGAVAWTENVTGSFNADNTAVSLDTVPVGGGATFKVTNAPMNKTTVIVDTNGTWTQNIVEFRIGAPTITGGSVIDTIEYKNHGEFVSAAGGGKEAAQACAGMPVNSTQGK